MQRLLALLIGVAVAGAAGHLSRLHTHAYTEHEHSEHRHGLASHEHQLLELPEVADNDGRPHVESCEPGQHQVTLTVGSAPASSVERLDADATTAIAAEEPRIVRAAQTPTDVRVHGPPPRETGPSRAPPRNYPA